MKFFSFFHNFEEVIKSQKVKTNFILSIFTNLDGSVNSMHTVRYAKSKGKGGTGRADLSNGLLAETEKFPAKEYNMNYTVVVSLVGHFLK